MGGVIDSHMWVRFLCIECGSCCQLALACSSLAPELMVLTSVVNSGLVDAYWGP